MINETIGSPIDLRISRAFRIAQFTGLAIVSLLSLTILLAWLITPLQETLPDGWFLMKANTAFCFLMSAAATLSFYVKPIGQSSKFARIPAFLVLFFALVTLNGIFYGHPGPLDTLFAEDNTSTHPGMMSRNTSLFFAFSGVFLLLANPSSNNKFKNIFCDLLLSLMDLIIIVTISGYIFESFVAIGEDETYLTSVHTLVCMICLSFTLTAFPGNTGIFSILLGQQQGSRIVRATFLPAICLPFITLGLYSVLLNNQWMGRSNAASLSTSIMVPLIVLVIFLMGRKINRLQGKLESISYTDELTKIYNRRGFYMFGLHMYHESLRNSTPLTILFFDVDGLKRVNDTMGHEVGSAMLKDIARLLRKNFRVNDIVARLGGDEFAVVSASPIESMLDAVRRMAEHTRLTNDTENKAYTISYSVGESVLQHGAQPESFNQLIDKADSVMYERKMAKKQKQRESSKDNNKNSDII